MSDTEAIAVLRVISSITSIIEGTKQVYDTTTSAEGLPEAFRVVASQLPIITNILGEAEQCIKEGGVTEDLCKGVKQVIKACQEKAKKLEDLFRKVIPGDNASRRKRYLSAVRTLGKGNEVEKLMKGTLEEVQLLACEHHMKIATKAQLEQIAKAIREVSAIPPSVPENGFQEASLMASYFPQVNSSHPPLDQSKRQIRLISVYEDADGKIACNLSVFDLSSCPHFIALSYVWGSPDIQHEITLNGHAFSIRHNLHSALKSIIKTTIGEQGVTNNSLKGVSSAFDADELKGFEQSSRCWKYFWIDAICINQREVSERNHQVRMMSNIYKSAVFVLVWLGLSCEKALHLLATADLAKLRAVYRLSTNSFRKSEVTESLVPLLESDYWSRMWIVQEFVLARDIVFASGSVLVHWDHVNYLFPEVYAYSHSGEYGSAISLVNERRQHIFRQKHDIRPDLHELVRRFGFMNCSDPRDRVFALYGLLGESTDQAHNILIVDYSLTPAQLSVKILGLASKSIKHRAPLEELHGWLNTALEVNQYDFDIAVNKERDLILKTAINRCDSEPETEPEIDLDDDNLEINWNLISIAKEEDETDLDDDSLEINWNLISIAKEEDE